MTLQLDTYTGFNFKIGDRALQKQKYKIMGLLLCVHAHFFWLYFKLEDAPESKVWSGCTGSAASLQR